MRKLITILLTLMLALPLVIAVAPTITHPDDLNIARGDGVILRWIVTDADNTTGNYTIYWNGDATIVGDWSNDTAFSFDAGSSWAYSTRHNITVDASDWISNVTDTVFVTVGGYAFGNVRMFVELLPFLILAIVMFMVVMRLRTIAP